MSATAPELIDAGLDNDVSSVDFVDAQQEDAYWARHYWREGYYRPDCEYEDYAPAYCVGYVGYSQYGGSYSDAEPSLCANWERIKGASRLCLDDARLAIRAAWNRLERDESRTPQWRELCALVGPNAQRPRWDQAANQPVHRER